MREVLYPEEAEARFRDDYLVGLTAWMTPLCGAPPRAVRRRTRGDEDGPVLRVIERVPRGQELARRQKGGKRRGASAIPQQEFGLE